MSYKLLFVISVVCFACFNCFGQSSYKGLTPGKSTRADVDKALGQPTSQVTERLLEYNNGGKQIYVQYSQHSPPAIRIQVIYSPSSTRPEVLAREGLPQIAETRRTNRKEALEEYFGNPKYIVLTYEEHSQNQVGQVGYYSRELFESAVGKDPSGTGSTAAVEDRKQGERADLAPNLSGAIAKIEQHRRVASNNPFSGRWSGSWTNSKGESGDSSVSINEQDAGTITGDEDGWVIENGHRSGSVLSWEYRKQNNGCRDYRVRWEISSDGRTANGTYQVTDRCEKQSYTGTYLNYRRSSPSK